MAKRKKKTFDVVAAVKDNARRTLGQPPATRREKNRKKEVKDSGWMQYVKSFED